MNKLTRISATVASSLALVAGFSGVAGAAPSIHDTGRDSFNLIKQENQVRTQVKNHTDLHLTNNNPQTATTGDVNANCDNNVSSVTTGDASNDSWVEAHVNVDNTSSSSMTSDTSMDGGSGGGSLSNASISDTGRDSTNIIKSENSVSTKVDNNTDVTLKNNNSQTATSGDVNVNGDNNVKNVSTGDATNTSTAVFDVSVTN